ncbi:unnamed protein product [Soboliphyme baturini]|uniref:2OG-FeII_Oxy_2 domain-containing protein n=1 Tax=Soboliphyme baturini TaxID=241478 RepID=A0A183IYD2_9BILA|nr:unnamed protein product [Soboliphyme baturini]
MILYVANGGVMCGVSFDELDAFLQQSCSSTYKIVVRPNKPYVFVDFGSQDDAQHIVEQWQGQTPTNFRSNTKLYFLYVQNVPPGTCLNWDGLNERGVVLHPKFITEAEEQALLEIVLSPDRKRSVLKNRTVMHFGYEFVYGVNSVNLDASAVPEIPYEIKVFINRIVMRGISNKLADQVTINIYSPGQGIPLHVDSVSSLEGEIFIISLGSDVNLN